MSQDIDPFVYYSFPVSLTKPTSSKRLSPLDKFIVRMYEISPVDQVEVWFIEFNKEMNTVTRELGLDRDGKLVYMAPTQRNFGFWSDTNITLADYQRFQPEPVTKSRFHRMFRDGQA